VQAETTSAAETAEDVQETRGGGGGRHGLAGNLLERQPAATEFRRRNCPPVA